MKHFLLIYDYRDDYMDARTALRPAHLKLAYAALDAGEMVLAGAFPDAPYGGVLVFQGEGPEVAEKFARADPYVRNGLVTRWQVREWTTVVGALALNPVARPVD